MNTDRWITVKGVEQIHGETFVMIHVESSNATTLVVSLPEAALLAAEIQSAIRGYVWRNLAGAFDMRTGLHDVPMLTTDDPKLRDALARCGVGMTSEAEADDLRRAIRLNYERAFPTSELPPTYIHMLRALADAHESPRPEA